MKKEGERENKFVSSLKQVSMNTMLTIKCGREFRPNASDECFKGRLPVVLIELSINE